MMDADRERAPSSDARIHFDGARVSRPVTVEALAAWLAQQQDSDHAKVLSEAYGAAPALSVRGRKTVLFAFIVVIAVIAAIITFFVRQGSGNVTASIPAGRVLSASNEAHSWYFPPVPPGAQFVYLTFANPQTVPVDVLIHTSEPSGQFVRSVRVLAGSGMDLRIPAGTFSRGLTVNANAVIVPGRVVTRQSRVLYSHGLFLPVSAHPRKHKAIR